MNGKNSSQNSVVSRQQKVFAFILATVYWLPTPSLDFSPCPLYLRLGEPE
jgi:hypothetical protein